MDVVMMMGFDREACGRIIRPASSWGELPVEGPLGVVVRERRIAGEERDAAFWSACARSPWCIMVVSRDLRETRFGLESTRWNRGLSSMLATALSSLSSSHSSSESSSSIALSSESSSDSLSMASSLSEVMSWMVRVLTWLLKDRFL